MSSLEISPIEPDVIKPDVIKPDVIKPDVIKPVLIESGSMETAAQATPLIYIASFYKFIHLPDYRDLRLPFLNSCTAFDIRGTILLAEEGINGTIAGTRSAVDAVLAFLRSDPRLADLEHKESEADLIPFDRMKVRLKREIITMGSPSVDPTAQVGTYVEPEDWNRLISDPEVLLVDTRNHYEVELGTFKGAVDPQTRSFRQFPNYVRNFLNPGRHKKVALFCTGGIRCEKASSFMLAQGFEEVYHLRGGILKYLQTIPASESLWEGQCFVFDQRVAVDHEAEGSEE